VPLAPPCQVEQNPVAEALQDKIESLVRGHQALRQEHDQLKESTAYLEAKTAMLEGKLNAALEREVYHRARQDEAQRAIESSTASNGSAYQAGAAYSISWLLHQSLMDGFFHPYRWRSYGY
jgi:hypothetical protein